MLKSETQTKCDGWSIDTATNHGESWYVLRFGVGAEQVSIPFDNVHASGGLVVLKRDGRTCATLNGALDGDNTKRHATSVPNDILNEMKNIGPW